MQSRAQRRRVEIVGQFDVKLIRVFMINVIFADIGKHVSIGFWFFFLFFTVYNFGFRRGIASLTGAAV